MSEENKNYNIDNENEPTNKDSFESVNEEPVYYSSLEQFYTDCDGDSKNVKGPKKITLSAFIISAVALMLAAAMLTWSLCMGAYREKLFSVLTGEYADLWSFARAFKGITIRTKDIVEAYREYYRFKKSIIRNWKYTNAEEPEWLKQVTAEESPRCGQTVPE